MGKVLIWFVIIISTVVLYCLMKVKAESDELYEELMKKHFYGRSDDIPASDQTKHLKGVGNYMKFCKTIMRQYRKGVKGT